MSFLQTDIFSRVNEQLNSFKRELQHVDIIPFDQVNFDSSEYCNMECLRNAVVKVKRNTFPTIYNLSCEDDTARTQLINRYHEFQRSNSIMTRGRDRLNISRYNNTTSPTLYLGSSMTDISGRIKQHLGGGNFRTYSLHLSKWANDIQYRISVTTYSLKHIQGKEIQRPFVELIEQALWEHYKPIFGKKSGL